MNKERNNLSKYSLLDGVIHYLFPLLMISIPPILIRPLADKLGYWNYSSISEFASGYLLAIIWTVSLILFCIFSKKMQKKGIFTRFEDSNEMISTKSLLLSSLIFFTMILIISIRIDFKVKPFYDFGEKLTGYDLINKLGILIKLLFRCAFIPVVCRGAYILSGISDKKYIRYPLYVLLVVGYGVFEILYYHVGFPFIYTLFYMSFAVLFLLMRKNYRKTLALSLLIYLL